MVYPDSHKGPRSPRGTWDSPRVKNRFRRRGYHPLWQAFPDLLAIAFQSHIGVPQPRLTGVNRFRLFPFRSPLLGYLYLIFIPGGTEMFQFPPSAPKSYFI